jgi:NAD(P)-dependent dehydrogenase (short-subunit alcohol dehydrogenase family)
MSFFLKEKWGIKDIPSQEDKVIIITGASSGLGKQATKVLAEKGALVIMAVRNLKKAEVVANEIKTSFPKAKLEVMKLDLSNLSTVKEFAQVFIEKYKKLDVLINNAGVMMSPYSKTDDGFELQMGTNHLGHFALTGHLLPLLLATDNSRVVVTSSLGHRMGDLNFKDIFWEKRMYITSKAYCDSKLANLYFAYELERKLKDDLNAPIVVSSHPGLTQTELVRHSGVLDFLGNIAAQPLEIGTLPTLRAATDTKVESGEYYGPGRMMETRGNPVIVQSSRKSHNKKKAKKLWDLSVSLTGVKY